MENDVKILVERAARVTDANEAMKFAQAALNCAQAYSCLESVKLRSPGADFHKTYQDVVRGNTAA